MSKVELVCPHCGTQLRPFTLPEEGGWGLEPHWACFNNDCAYFLDGWDWMRDQFNVRGSYRYRVTGPGQACSPLVVPDENALLDRIIASEES